MIDDVKVGDEVLLPCCDWLVVQDIKTETVRTRTKGELKFTKLYFGDKHAPAYTYEVLDCRRSLKGEP